VLRIERADDEYKTADQWKKLGFEPVIPEGHHYPVTDAVSIVHSTVWYRYYRRDHVRGLTLPAPDKGDSPAPRILSTLEGDSTAEHEPTPAPCG
jgi:hypothetical protein